eukprot:CAMPEP_0206245484 /NCGR_PEP_ID=MMETSP0047_2-20121206/18721_1 /ASSEMBLY_ACC=CAM_ASM_000192 /TAXON_ID=195065 /ORGANISM="Chroomonas mesostigmatica_cf, Strain CCMP1168" /LENGTH=291 /DNA_ID=CAMNT_0053670785 /DNA_START=399 /DNA_END=1275 /DNA_ORIENTATION=+
MQPSSHVEALVHHFLRDLEGIAKHHPALHAPLPLDLAEEGDKLVRAGGAVDAEAPIDDEGWDRVHPHSPKQPHCRLDVGEPLPAPQEGERLRLVDASSLARGVSEHHMVVELASLDEVALVQKIVERLSSRGATCLGHPLHHAVAVHRVAGHAVEVEMLNANLLPTLFEPVPLLLHLPAGLAPPLPDQADPVGLLEFGVLRVVRLEEEGHPDHREAQGLSRVHRLFRHLLHRVAEVAFADEAVGSHGVRDQLDVHHQALGRAGQAPTAHESRHHARFQGSSEVPRLRDERG